MLLTSSNILQKCLNLSFALAQPSDHQIKIFLALLSDTVVYWEFFLYMCVCVCVFGHDMMYTFYSATWVQVRTAPTRCLTVNPKFQ